MLWTECDPKLQQKIIHKIYELVTKEDNIEIRQGLVAAAYELEIWSTPEVEIETSIAELTDEEYVAIAQDTYIEPTSNSILSLFFGRST